jgi:hypothetical protein
LGLGLVKGYVPPLVRLLSSLLPFVSAALAVGFAVQRWLWFRTLPRFSPVRFCGNCFLGVMGVPTELALLALLWAFVSLLGIRSDGDEAVYWCSALAGILLTPFVIGMPVFVFGFLALVFLTVKSLFTRGAFRHADYWE